MLQVLLAMGIAFSTTLANAVPAAESKLQMTTEPVAAENPKGIVPFLGVTSGYSTHTNSGVGEGVPSAIKALGSYYFDNKTFVLDLGLGFHSQQFNRIQADRGAANTGALEFAARHQFLDRWQAGAIFQDLFSQGRAFQASQEDAHFLGVQLLKEFNSDNWLFRVGGRLMTDTNVPTNTVNMAMIDLQMGWGMERRTSVRPVAVTSPAPIMNKPVPMPETVTPILKNLVSREILGSTRPLLFASNSSELQSADRDRLTKIGKKIAQAKFQKVRIVGHADRLGRSMVNDELAQARAESVRATLIAAGVPASQIEIISMGDRLPVKTKGKTPNDLSPNRRVEIDLLGTPEADKLKNEISSFAL